MLGCFQRQEEERWRKAARDRQIELKTCKKKNERSQALWRLREDERILTLRLERAGLPCAACRHVTGEGDGEKEREEREERRKAASRACRKQAE